MCGKKCTPIEINIIPFETPEILYHRSVTPAIVGYGKARFVMVLDSARAKFTPESNNCYQITTFKITNKTTSLHKNMKK